MLKKQNIIIIIFACSLVGCNQSDDAKPEKTFTSVKQINQIEKKESKREEKSILQKTTDKIINTKNDLTNIVLEKLEDKNKSDSNNNETKEENITKELINKKEVEKNDKTKKEKSTRPTLSKTFISKKETQEKSSVRKHENNKKNKQNYDSNVNAHSNIEKDVINKEVQKKELEFIKNYEDNVLKIQKQFKKNEDQLIEIQKTKTKEMSLHLNTITKEFNNECERFTVDNIKHCNMLKSQKDDYELFVFNVKKSFSNEIENLKNSKKDALEAEKLKLQKNILEEKLNYINNRMLK